MAKIIGSITGTTYKDFVIHPGYTTSEHIPSNIDINTKIGDIVIKPFLPAAMRSIVDERFALEAAKIGLMAVAPRGLSIQKQVDIVRYVKENEVKKGEIESIENPVTLLDDNTIADAIENVSKYGHSNMPVKDRLGRYKGMFKYEPLYHDRMEPNTPIQKIMKPFDYKKDLWVSDNMSEKEIKEFMKKYDLRLVPVLEEIETKKGKEYRLRKLVFRQENEGYRIGGAIDTHPGWEERAKALVEAGADIIFIDTSDAYTEWASDVVKRFKEKYERQICAGNIVTPEGFRYLAKAGADAIKIGMGPGSICITSAVLGVGAPPFSSLVRIAKERDRYADKRYIPIIADGGMEDTHDICIALTHADAIMSGKLFACFEESAGKLVEKNGKKFKEYWGEGSKRAAETTGDMKRYEIPGERQTLIYQGVDGLVLYQGYLKPGVEKYSMALKITMSHVGAKNLEEYRKKAVLERLSEASKRMLGPHDIVIIDE
ncbi:MAG: IMP dehydrogenase [Candidatus Aenigmatarchaeota archaeon]